MERTGVNGAPYRFSAAKTRIALLDSTGTPCNATGTYSDSVWDKYEPIDVNGDGRADLRFHVSGGPCRSADAEYESLHFLDAKAYAQRRAALPRAGDEFWVVFRNRGQSGGDHNFTLHYQVQSAGTAPVASNDDDKFFVVDLNSDGASDLVYKQASTDAWLYQMGTGYENRLEPIACVRGGTPPSACLPSRVQNETRSKVRVEDADGDGYPDFWENDGSTLEAYSVFRWTGSGFSSTGYANGLVAQNGNDWIIGIADLDGDSMPDQLLVKHPQTASDGDWETRRSTSRHLARNVVDRITNGLAAQTLIEYAPMTFSSIYRRDYDGPYGLASGRGSPVLDISTPQYAVSVARSSAPMSGLPDTMSRVLYRYQGLKMQSGGRGMLGFRRVYTIDAQNLIETESTYGRDFPLAGIAADTVTRYRGNLPTDACARTNPAPGGYEDPTAGCFVRAPVCGPTQSDFNIVCDPAPVGTELSRASDEWHWRLRNQATRDPSLIGLGPTPLFAFRTRSQTTHHEFGAGDPQSWAPDATPNGTEARRETTEFLAPVVVGGTCPDGYDHYGNVCRSRITKSEGAGAATLVATIDNEFAYQAVDEAVWHLGRLITTRVATDRYNSGAATSTVKTSTFVYESTTGLLIAEHLQPSADSSQQLHTYTLYDGVGNKRAVATCSTHHATHAACTAPIPADGTPPGSALTLTMNPNDPTEVRRYVRYEHDALERYVDRTFEPYATAAGAIEALSSQVVARTATGDPTDVRDANGVQTIAAYGSLGRKYFDKSATGASSQTSYVTCTTNCPPGTVYREDRLVVGAPPVWTFFDKLGRPGVVVRQSFVSTAFVSTLSNYDATGRIVQVSEPFFSQGPNSGAANPVGEPIYWSSTTFDALGRPIAVTQPDGSVVRNYYDALTTTTTLPANGSGAVQWKRVRKDALDAIVTIDEPNGAQLRYEYHPSGALMRAQPWFGATPGGAITITLDDVGRKTAMSDPDMGAWSYAVNAVGETVRQSGPRGTCTQTNFDARGRMWRRRDLFGSSSGATCAGTVEKDATWQYDRAAQGLGALSSEVLFYGAQQVVLRSFAYDSLGRPASVDTQLDAALQRMAEPGRAKRRSDGPAPRAPFTTYRTRSTYDQYSRPFQNFFASDTADGLPEMGELIQYNAQGFTEAIRSAYPGTTGAVYQQTLAVNALGAVTSEQRATGVAIDTTRQYDPATGRLTVLTTDSGRLQSLAYTYDVLGNVTQRIDQTTGRYLRETFTYDALQRLTLTTQWNQAGGQGPTVTQVYDAGGAGTGNITSKTDVGSYTYGTQPAECAIPEAVIPGPHAVSALGAGFECYDAHGNNLRSLSNSATTARGMSYSAADQLTWVIAYAANRRVEFHYGPNRERVKRADFDTTVATTASQITHVVGNTEVHRLATGRIEVKRYVAGLIVYTSRETDATIQKRRDYLFGDHLGSATVVTTDSGTIVSPNGSMGYDPWGRRRDPNTGTVLDWVQWPAFDSSRTTRHGYTGHEMIDTAGFIHMNGRIYAPDQGRMRQADPIIQDPYSSQSFNRYTYVNNSPLAYTDPSGYWGRSEQAYLRTAAAIVIAVYTGYYIGPAGAGANLATGAKLAIVATSGFTSGALQAGDLKGGLPGAFSALVFFGIGEGFARAGLTDKFGTPVSANAWAGTTLSHGVAGGVMAQLQGGRFGHGFVSAGLTEALEPAIAGIGGDIGQGLMAAIVGGTASAASGGKFANGAATAAFAYAVSSAASGGCGSCDASGAPAGADWSMRSANPDWQDRLSVVDENGVMVIRGELTVSGSGSAYAVSDVNAHWYGATGSYQGVSYRSEVKLVPVARGGDWKMRTMSRKDWAALSRRAGGTVGGQNAIGESIMKMTPDSAYWQQRSVPAHEFGHALGLSHAPMGSGSIMSYDPGRAVGGRDLYNVAGGYR